MKIRRDPLDEIFSEYIRATAGWKCERCRNMPDRRGLHCHHFEKRRKKSTRWDEDNALSLCWGCHQYFQENRNEEVAFMICKLGQERFDMLKSRSRIPAHYIDKSALMLYYQHKLKEIKGKED